VFHQAELKQQQQRKVASRRIKTRKLRSPQLIFAHFNIHAALAPDFFLWLQSRLASSLADTTAISIASLINRIHIKIYLRIWVKGLGFSENQK